MIDKYTPTLLPDPYGQLDSSMPAIPQYSKPSSGMDVFKMAEMLRKKQTTGMMGNQQTPNWSNPYESMPSYTNQIGGNYGVGTGGYE